jgi:hypothetical protein
MANTCSYLPKVTMNRFWFASPRSLDLEVFCTGKNRAKEMSDTWPVLQIQAWGYGDAWSSRKEDNIIAALEHKDRVRQIQLLSFGFGAISSSDSSPYFHSR